jgi:ABC-type sugar transport system ATPase subunit
VARVGTLRLADQQKVAILRALARDARLIVMDEPTGSLPRTDAESVLAVIRGLAAEGTTIVFVSHFLKEVLAVADMVTVLKDGRVIRTAAAREESEEKLVSAMLGRALEQRFPDRRKHHHRPTPVLEVRSLTRRGAFEDVSLALDAGEIVGIAGLVGSGRSELARAIAGVDRFDGGELLVNGRTLAMRHPAAAIKAGIALIPDNRRREGLVMGQTIAENVTLPHLNAVSTCGIVRRRREAEVVERAARQSMMKVTPAQPVVNLSGGTQQKVMFAKWLVRRPTVLISDEPTRGIDVGAKRGIYDALTAFSITGVALLVISNEVDELLGLCHRIVVMRRGRLVAEFDGGEATEEAIMRVALGATEASMASRAGSQS